MTGTAMISVIVLELIRDQLIFRCKDFIHNGIYSNMDVELCRFTIDKTYDIMEIIIIYELRG